MRIMALLTFTCLASAIAAQTPMTLEKFEAYVTGRTFDFYVTGDGLYGIEAYGPNQQVIWAELDNICTDGRYFAGTNDDICFEYPEWGSENCVQFFRVPGGMDGIGFDGAAYEARETDRSMPCVGPLLGS